MNRILLIAFVVLVQVGCNASQEPARFPVRGTVLVDGQPLAEGLIYFKTIATGAIDSAPIKDGKFEGQAEAGQRRVEIVSPKTVDNPNATPGMLDKEQIETIPARYNRDSTLEEVVKADGANEYQFDLKAK